MFAKKQWMQLSFVLLIVSACSSGGQATGRGSTSAVFSAVADSAVSVNLAWAAVPDASGYLVEAKYGSGEFFEIAQLGAEETTYIHFVVPNSQELTYRLSVVKDGSQEQVGTALVSVPELKPNPIIVTQVQLFPPVVSGGAADLLSMPTIDPLNPDPNAMATMVAMATQMSNMNPEDLLPEVTPVSVTQVIGPDGGTIEFTAPNGVRIELNFPAGLFDQATSVVVDPIEAINDLPFTELLSAIDIRPHFPFDIPVTLTFIVEDPSPSVDKSIVGFVEPGLTQGLSLTPLYDLTSSTYSMLVYSGGLAGFAMSTKQELVDQVLHIPTGPGAQLDQQIAALEAINRAFSDQPLSAALSQVSYGLLDQLENPNAYLPDETGRIAAARPQLQSGSASGSLLNANLLHWERVWNHFIQGGTNGLVNQADPSVLTQQQRAEVVRSLASQIHEFLETHTGCRTRDEFYAQVFLRMLRSPLGEFRESLTDMYNSNFGDPENLKHCSFNLHFVTSKMVADDSVGNLVAKVHIDPFPLQAYGQDGDIELIGLGFVTYEELSDLTKNCPPRVNLLKPTDASLWITSLRPIFDDDGRVTDFILSEIDAGDFGSISLGSIHAKVTADCVVQSFSMTEEAPDMWGVGYTYVRSLGPVEHWQIVGESSYVATSNEDVGEVGGGIDITVETTIVLTVNQED